MSDSSGSTIRKLCEGLNNLASAYVFTVAQLQILGPFPSTGFIQRKRKRKTRTTFMGKEQGTGGTATLISIPALVMVPRKPTICVAVLLHSEVGEFFP